MSVHLTQEERVVLDGIARGQTFIHIGRRLGRSEHGAKYIARVIYRKLGAQSQAHAITRAFEVGALECRCRTSYPPGAVPLDDAEPELAVTL